MTSRKPRSDKGIRFEPEQFAAQLKREIEEAIALVPAEQDKHPEWITTAVCNKHPAVHGNDVDFWTIVGRAEIRSRVRAALNAYKVTGDEPSRQVIFAGFEHLQTHYLVKVGSEQVAVAIGNMTAEQWDAKEREFESMAAGLQQHLREIRRYRAAGGSEAVAA